VKAVKTNASATAGESFRRVKSENYDIKEKNDYQSSFGNNGYGHNANQTMMDKRGKDFKAEKTKKKRGSYRGGAISMESNSIKFNE